MPNDLRQKSRLASAFSSQQNPLIIFLRVKQAWLQRQEQLEQQQVLMQQELQRQEPALAQKQVQVEHKVLEQVGSHKRLRTEPTGRQPEQISSFFFLYSLVVQKRWIN